MREDRLSYRRKVTNVGSWREFSVQHVAFSLHRVTGWLLLGWVLVHLGVPLLTAGPSVWNPLVELSGTVGTAVVTGLFAVLVFHAFNGVRLLAAELLGLGAGNVRPVFLSTLAASALLVVVMGGTL